MSLLLASLVGYLIGSFPTANLLAQLKGIDLRRDGSKNPGANNARRLGGMGLAASVLLAEAGKGVGAVLAGSSIDGQVGMVAAGIAAVVGNVYNVWYRLEGGKGLGITFGVLAAALPIGLLIAVVAIGVSVWALKSSGLATLATLVLLIVVALTVPETMITEGRGLNRISLVAPLIVGLAIVISPKHFRDARNL